ncbi:serine/threonine protein kinase [bacterium]|nr:serine/threonine protein kinase [bacterium]
MVSDSVPQPDEPAIPREKDVIGEQLASSQSEVVGGDGSVHSGDGSERIAEAETVIRGSSRGPSKQELFQPKQGSPAAVAQVLLGQHLNHFLLEALIGGGGMGAVFRAHDDQLDRTVAIKVIPFVGDDPDLRRRFRNEAQSAAKLDHPKIARVFDVGSQADWHYIVFEYIEGINIRDLVRKSGVLSVDDAVLFTSQLGDALQHASNRGIVHRDIKPSNVLITNEDGIKLVDMGLARSANLDFSEDMTASGVTLGTFDYISPEQATDPRDADLRSDLYSLGCTLYFMLTGSPPYPGGTMLQKLLSHGNAPPPDVRKLRPQVSDSLAAVVEKMLAKKPSDRYQTAHDLMADLREVAQRDGLVRSQALNPSPIIRTQPWMLLVERHASWVVAVVLMLVVAGWLQLQSLAYRVEVQVPDFATQEIVTDPALVDSVSGGLNQEQTNGSSQGNSGEPQIVPGEVADEGQEVTEEMPVEDSPVIVDPNESSRIRSDEMSPLTEGESSEFPVTSKTEETDQESGLDPEIMLADRASEINFADIAVDIEVGVIRVVDKNFTPDPDLEREGIVTTNSLEEALDLARQHASTSRIELAVPVIVCNQSVILESDDLLITSTVGGTTILFDVKESLAMARAKMFSIGSHPIVFEDIHFVWNVPDDDLDGGCLFESKPNDLIRFTDCTITINNPSKIDEVHAFEVITDQDRIEDRQEYADETLPLVWLELNNVIVRGQMSMLKMDYATRLWLDWDNGLLAVTDRMIDTSGARQKPEPESGPIRLKFWRVTAHAPKGILLMRVGVSGAYPVNVDRLAHECVFWVDAAVPHYDFRGVDSVSLVQPLKLQGASNTYVTNPGRSDPMLRVSSQGENRDLVTMDEIAGREVEWAADKSPRWTVDWAFEGVVNVPASQRSPANYRQEDESPLGFDEKALPNPPARSEFDVNTVRAALRFNANR